jgi:ABC-type cobalamin/Fe3+-siderophores transport system ATPase subunit
LLEASRITFSYGRTAVLQDVGLTLAPGRMIALLGPNGSGKSTLIRVLLGHLQAPGTVRWEGKPLHAWPRRDLARVVAYLPQAPAWESEQPVGDVLRLGRAPYLRAFGLESEQDLKIVQEVAGTLELTDLLHRRMDQLSGGQRQRVFLGRALAQQPRAMLLDEPTTFLDLRHQVDLCRLLRTLARDHGLGILMALHDLNLAALFADELILLDGGQVAASGAPAEVLQPDLLARVYGVPMQRVERDGRPAVVFPDVDT